MKIIQQKAPHEYCDGYRDALCNRRENPQGCEMYALGYRAGFEATLTADYQARLADDLDTLARADEKRGQIPEVQQAFAEMHVLYLDHAGNYRTKPDRKITPFNRTLKRHFRTFGDVWRASRRAGQAQAA